MIHIPPDIKDVLNKTVVALSALKMLRTMGPHTTACDFRQAARIKARLALLCPPSRYAWIDGRPCVDILETLNQIEKEDKKHERNSKTGLAH